MRKFAALDVPDFNPIAMAHLQIRVQDGRMQEYVEMAAAVNIAFAVPDHGETARPSRERPIDLVHLAKQTMGDKALEIEVLQMFARQSRTCLQEIASSDKERVAAAAHRLKGAASSVGAFRLASAAERLEQNDCDASAMADVGAGVIEAENFILKLCR